MEIIRLNARSDIPLKFQNTPIEELILYQNFNAPHKTYTFARLLVGMCMDNRKQLKIPENFAYIIRTGGANLRCSEFYVSYAVAVGGVNYIALIAHDRCGMVDLALKMQPFIEGLSRLENWTPEQVREHFLNHAPKYEIEDETEFVLAECKRLSAEYKGVTVVPLYYTLDDNKLSMIAE